VKDGHVNACLYLAFHHIPADYENVDIVPKAEIIICEIFKKLTHKHSEQLAKEAVGSLNKRKDGPILDVSCGNCERTYRSWNGKTLMADCFKKRHRSLSLLLHRE
jgi:protein-arginine kinase activator protein McsA